MKVEKEVASLRLLAIHGKIPGEIEAGSEVKSSPSPNVYGDCRLCGARLRLGKGIILPNHTQFGVFCEGSGEEAWRRLTGCNKCQKQPLVDTTAWKIGWHIDDHGDACVSVGRRAVAIDPRTNTIIITGK